MKKVLVAVALVMGLGSSVAFAQQVTGDYRRLAYIINDY